MTIEPHSLVVRTVGLLTAPVDDEIVIFNPARDNYIGLNAIGCVVWDLIEQPREVAELCRSLSGEFDATPDQITADLLSFLAQMAEERLVRVTAAP